MPKRYRSYPWNTDPIQADMSFLVITTIASKMKNSRERRKFSLAKNIASKMKNSRERRKFFLAKNIAS